MYCMECGAEIAAETKFCGKCGTSQTVESAAAANNVIADKPKRSMNKDVAKPLAVKNSKGLQSIITIAIFAGFAWYLYGGGIEKQAAKNLHNIHNQVANDQVEQYEISKRGGNKIEICVHAGLVAASYLQAKDESNYQRWQQTKSDDCAAAGMPR